MDLPCGTTAAPRSADKTNATKSARSPLVPVPLNGDVLRGLNLFQTFVVGELSIVPTDASWREIAARTGRSPRALRRKLDGVIRRLTGSVA